MRIDGLPQGPQMAPSPRLKEACQQFEALMLAELFKQMRATASAWRDEESSFASGLYQEWQDQALSESMAKSGGIGLAEMLYRQLQRQQMEGSGGS